MVKKKENTVLYRAGLMEWLEKCQVIYIPQVRSNLVPGSSNTSFIIIRRKYQVLFRCDFPLYQRFFFLFIYFKKSKRFIMVYLFSLQPVSFWFYILSRTFHCIYVNQPKNYLVYLHLRQKNNSASFSYLILHVTL